MSVGIKDKSGWEILIDKLNRDIKEYSKMLKERNHPSEMVEEDYSCDEDMWEDKSSYYSLQSSKSTLEHIKKYITDGGK